ncbi:membrane protein [Flavobacterium noncentrifugens]|uniref:Uncharacterized membrane protein n=1 Tax=Flavobacterium noncentrifugens TaxID=1128970 RepID=A0A1G8ZQ41_9FLAO|nr:DoxX family membrane protein [Flavobacterium noncentrifugens]GEP51877.1 membrane protein [Flavobacterium noncentrifugens]SDK17143.1 Uncharacterized membrane protein [Flavobacterium noncentrifugens]
MDRHHTTKTQNIFRILLGLMLVIAGTGHLAFARIEFQAQVPDWVPMDKDLTVVLSGIVEILLGLVIIFAKRYRIQIGIFAAVFFVMVFPGNIAQYLNERDAFGLNSDSLRIMRLFFQPVLIFWALWASGAWDHLHRHKGNV